MPIGATIAAVGSVAGAGISAYGAKSAADKAAATASKGITAQQGMFNTAKEGLDPYIKSGQSVLPTLQSLLTPGASQMDTLKQLPGFDFASKWGTNAATNALAARGLGGSTGPLARGVSDYNSGLASTYWGNAVNALQNFANTGASAAGSLGNNAVTTGGNMATTFGNIGNIQGSGILGQTNALATGVGGVSNSITNAMLLQKLGIGGGIYGQPVGAEEVV